MSRSQFTCHASRFIVVVSLALAAAVTSATVCPAQPQPGYLPVYGGPTYGAGAGGALESSAFVNDAGTAVTAGGQRAFRWDSSGMPPVELGNLGADASGLSSTSAHAVNNFGIAIGSALKYDASGADKGTRPVRWDPSGSAATELGNLGTDSSGVTFGSAIAINDAGAAVGWTNKYDGSGLGFGARAVRWDVSGAATELGGLGAGIGESYAFAVNDAGTAVGRADKFDASGERIGGWHAVRWDASGTATELGGLGTGIGGSSLNRAYAINAGGTAIGVADKFDALGNYLGERAVRWDGSRTTATELGSLGTVEGGTYVYAINDAGAAVGYAVKHDASGASKGERAVRWDGSGTTATELGTLGVDANGDTAAAAFAINNAGVAVGQAIYHDDSGMHLGYKAVYWGLDDLAVDLNTLIDPASGWMLHRANDISDTGWITGVGEFDPDGPGGQQAYQRLYLMHVPVTAIPEPATFAIVALGLAVLATVDTRSRKTQRPLHNVFARPMHTHH